MSYHSCGVRIARVFATALVIAVIAVKSLADSTGIPATASIEKSRNGSILGDTADGKTCKYKFNDKKVHCVYEDGASEEFLADAIRSPTFSGLGKLDFGNIRATSTKRYAFLNAETGSSVSGTDAVVYCKLALQFITSRNEIIWIWHDELYFQSGRHVAVLDTDGSGQPDLAVSGSWNGNMYGSNRWWTPSTTSSTYTAAERAYATRPTFGKINRAGKSRGCKPGNVRVATLKSLSANIGETVGTAVPTWRTVTRP